MKKIILTLLFASSTILFAKTDKEVVKTDLPKNEEKVLIAKKNIKDEKVEIKLKTRTNLEQCLLDVAIIDAVSPVPGAGAHYFATTCVPIILSGQ
nr:hypothetical protein [uncultured Chryseobacterium sp.]